MDYPFEPKSNAKLEAGQFWGIRLSDGRFGCGRVLDVPRRGDRFVAASRVAFLAGFTDWVGASPPTTETIAGARLVEQATAHIMTIRESGSPILGCRPLELDGIEPYLWRTHYFGRDVWVYRGITPVREARQEDSTLPVMAAWGYGVIRVLAETVLVEGKTLPPENAALDRVTLRDAD